jgi:hypothetical protein
VLPPSFRRHRAVALPPLLRCRHAAADIALSRCRHRRSIRAAATALPPSRCALPPRFALPSTLRCRTAATAEASALPPPRCCRRAVSRRRASRCRHRR